MRLLRRLPMTTVRKIAKDLMPPVALRAVRAVLNSGRNPDVKKEICCSIDFGDRYSCWNEAVLASDGYDISPILERVCQSTSRVRDGSVAAERDGVVFDK